MDLGEKIAEVKFLRNNFIYLDDGYIRFSELGLNKILTLFQDWLKEEVGKLKPLSEEETDKEWMNFWHGLNTELDDPLEAKQEGDAAEMDALEHIAQAQLEHNKKSLLDKIERME